ncbi:MAG: dihydrodipicolinate reductase [Mycoplasmatota bacterium]
MRIVQYGCGKMSLYTMQYAIDRGYEVVGAFDINPDIIGKDISTILSGDNKNVIINHVNNAEEILKELKPDACIVTTMSLLSDCKDILLLCAKLGINAITTCEEAFYPFNSNPTLANEIDLLAKENNCTISGTGYQDAFWGNLITTLAGATHNITKIKGSSSYNVEDYGIALAKAHGAGLSSEDFEKEIAAADNISVEERNNLINSGNFLPSYMWNVNGWMCDKLHLTVDTQTQKCIPTYHDEDIKSSTLNMVVTKGMATGMRAVVTTTTKEGITLETECIGKVYSSTEFDSNNWEVIGQPTTSLVIDRPQTVELTCATIVNRLVDLVASKPGFVPTSQMGELKAR